MAHSIYHPKLIYGFSYYENSNTDIISQYGLSTYTPKLTVYDTNKNIHSIEKIYGIELEIDDQTGIPFISENIKNKVIECYQSWISVNSNLNKNFNISNIKIGYHLAISSLH